MVTAIALGDVQIGNLDSSRQATAASRGLPIVTFIVAAQINAAEALVVRNGSGINSPQDLVGKTIATPFVYTTSHYSLLGAEALADRAEQSEDRQPNPNPNEITAAWARGHIDGPLPGRRGRAGGIPPLR